MMNEPSSKQIYFDIEKPEYKIGFDLAKSGLSTSIASIYKHPLVTSKRKPRETPNFDNKVDEIIHVLEHDNDPPEYYSLEEEMALEITKDIDEKILHVLDSICEDMK